MEEEQIFWPIYKEVIEKEKKIQFWNKTKCDIPSKEAIIVSEKMVRLGKHKILPKEYFFSITKDGKLYY
jgi:hypothetical protein